ncbi:MAG: hypothetical protein NTV24_04950 [Candidatus Woesebacteria bacterium]|nr:hypothetical protein [Candidatus Woesebacteria bacterium]
MEVIPLIGVSVWLAVKIFVLLFLAIYIIFALVVIRQIKLMSETLDMGLNLPIRFVGWAHFLFAVGIFVIALLIL